MTELLAVAIGLIAGAGYLSAEFWVRPILRYKDTKFQIIVDLVKHANAIAAVTGEGPLPERVQDRMSAERDSAAVLRACNWAVPAWYVRWLSARKEDPAAAARELIGLSNTTDHQEAARRVAAIKGALRFPRNLG